ncbi:MAG TPA: DUF2007 domain-containing protein [Patescibacteria group bacterium]|nr:DUF2007 domain-containing protein [Patescibacteria group bacterium]
MASENGCEMVELTSAQGEMEANIIRGVLNAEGIGTMTRGDMVQSVYPITVDGLGKVTIYVHEEDLVKARVVLKEYREKE